MANTRLSEKALFVERGYGQVEPNHLSAQRTGQIYAQLPAAADIKVLENGQFVKYDYKEGVVNYTGAGEWMLVFNEVKVYYDYQADHDFALKQNDYAASVYSPVGAATRTTGTSINLKGVVSAGIAMDGTDEPFGVESFTGPALMPKGTTMVPRVFKTNIGDIFTTNTIKDETVELGDILKVDTDGYLSTAGTSDMQWQVVKVYTMPDRQQGVKIMRIA